MRDTQTDGQTHRQRTREAGGGGGGGEGVEEGVGEQYLLVQNSATGTMLLWGRWEQKILLTNAGKFGINEKVVTFLGFFCPIGIIIKLFLSRRRFTESDVIILNNLFFCWGAGGGGGGGAVMIMLVSAVFFKWRVFHHIKKRITWLHIIGPVILRALTKLKQIFPAPPSPPTQTLLLKISRMSKRSFKSYTAEMTRWWCLIQGTVEGWCFLLSVGRHCKQRLKIPFVWLQPLSQDEYRILCCTLVG